MRVRFVSVNCICVYNICTSKMYDGNKNKEEVNESALL